MKCLFCSDEAVSIFDFNGEKYYGKSLGKVWVCQNHYTNLSNYAESQRKERAERERQEEEEKKYIDCPHCKAYTGNTFYGRLNKETQECSHEFCDYYSWNCHNCRKKMKGKKFGNGLKIQGYYNYFCPECLEKKKQELDEKIKKEQEEFRKPCSQCESKLGDIYYYDRTGEREGKFCSQECFKKIYKDNLEKVKKLINSMKNWEDISSYNWKDADWLDEKDKANCREYEKNRQQREKLKNEGKDYSNQTNNSDKIEENKTPASSGQYLSNQDNSQNNPFPFEPNQFSENDKSSFNCSFCEKSWTSDSEHNSQSPNCQKLKQISEKAFKNFEAGKLNDISDLKELPKKFQTYLIALQDIKIRKKKVDIDKLDLPEDAKKELKKIQDEELRKIQDEPKGDYGCGNCLSAGKDINFDSKEELEEHMRKFHGASRSENMGDVKNEPTFPKIFIGGGLFLIFVIILVIILKSRGKKNLLKRSKKRK